MKAAQAKRLKILNECNERIHTVIIHKKAGREKHSKKPKLKNNFYIDNSFKLMYNV